MFFFVHGTLQIIYLLIKKKNHAFGANHNAEVFMKYAEKSMKPMAS